MGLPEIAMNDFGHTQWLTFLVIVTDRENNGKRMWLECVSLAGALRDIAKKKNRLRRLLVAKYQVNKHNFTRGEVLNRSTLN